MSDLKERVEAMTRLAALTVNQQTPEGRDAAARGRALVEELDAAAIADPDNEGLVHLLARAIRTHFGIDPWTSAMSSFREKFPNVQPEEAK